MPADIRTAWSPATAPYRGDWLLDPPGMATDHNLETAVLLSLWTDDSAHPDDVIPDGTDDRRGWWGNWQRPETVALGSRLWLLEREKSTEETRRRAEEYAAEALQWLLDDHVAIRVDVAASYLEVGPVPPTTLVLQIQITRSDGTVYDRRFAWAWDELAAHGVATDAVVPWAPVAPPTITLVSITPSDTFQLTGSGYPSTLHGTFPASYDPAGVAGYFLDDGSQSWMQGGPVFSWTATTAQITVKTSGVPAGTHTVRVQLYDATGTTQLALSN